MGEVTKVDVCGITLLQIAVKIMRDTKSSCGDNLKLLQAMQDIKAEILSEFIAAMLQNSSSAPRIIKTETCKDVCASMEGNIITEEGSLKGLKREVVAHDPELAALHPCGGATTKKRIYRLQKFKSCPECSFLFSSVELYPKAFLQHVRFKHKEDVDGVFERYEDKMTIAFR
ncbi:hypothetical protein ONE63_003476 [Megalurothrips usitatus]|uniref:C2H2-type domain-containing protein n=1 Tax=Megalurothrips usitatus TaxID=439358 RepID=A0AAV7XDZ4_9NEOP|nr:hypothetical protein ONE63_003476 [Megalurothrips usitatus]